MSARGDAMGEAVADALRQKPDGSVELPLPTGLHDAATYLWKIICNALEPWWNEGADDHTVKSTDADTVFKALRDKLISLGDTVAISIADAAQTGDWERVNIEVKAAAQTAAASTFYPSIVLDPKYHTARCHLYWGEQHTYPGFSGTWQLIGVSTYQSIQIGPLLGFGSSVSFHVSDHDRVLIATLGSLPSDTNSPHQGLYEVLDCGIHTKTVSNEPVDGGTHEETVISYPIIRRVTTANTAQQIAGMVVKIDGHDVLDEGELFKITAPEDPGDIVVDVTPLTFEKIGYYSPSDSYLLLTKQQQAERGALDIFVVASANTLILNEAVLLGSPPASIWMTPPLGLTKIPAALVDFSALFGVTDSDPAPVASATLTAKLSVAHANGSIGSVICTAVSAPVAGDASGTRRIVKWQGGIAETTLLETDGIAISYYVTALSSTAGSADVPWSRPDTFVRLPVAAVGGAYTTDHRLLTNRDAPNQHPMNALGPSGRLQLTWPDAPMDANTLTMPDANDVRVTGSSDLIGIATAGWSHGAKIRLTFAFATYVIHGGNPAPGFAPIWLHKDGEGTQFDALPVVEGSTIELRYWTDIGTPDVGAWRIETL